MKVTTFKGINPSPIGDRDLKEIFDEIKNEKYKAEIAHYRGLLEEGKKEQAKAFKNALPAFTPSCTIKHGCKRAIKNAETHTGIIVVDVDNVNATQLELLKSMVGSMGYTFAYFESPSFGLKIFVKTDAAIEQHAVAWKQVNEYYSKELDIQIDESGKDISRLCYYAADCNLTLNDQSKVFHIQKSELKSPVITAEELTSEEIKRRFKDCVIWTNKYKTFVSGSRNIYCFTLANACNRKKIPQKETLGLILQDYGYDVSEVTASVASAYRHTEEHGLYADTPEMPELTSDKILYDDIELSKMESKNRYLLADILPTVGTSVIAGVPDAGKSQFARMLCLYITTGFDKFIGHALNTKHERALIVSTEDDQANTSFLLKRQLARLGKEATGNLSFIFANTLDTEELIIEIENHLTVHACDLVLIDCFGDIFNLSDSNNSISMRKVLKPFDYLSRKHSTHICFISHINKSAYGLNPMQSSISGGAGLVQKVRTAIQLSNGEGNYKYFSVVKENYTPRKFKQQSQLLQFDEEHFLFTDLNTLIATDEINNRSGKRESKDERLEKLADEIFDGKSLSYTEFCKNHQQINGTSLAQAQRDHKAMKERSIIIKDEKNWRFGNSIASNA